MQTIHWKIKSFTELSVTELYEILRIRQAVFVVEQTCNYLDADGYDDKAVHLWAETNGEILAYCRLFDSGIKYHEASIGRVLTNSNYRNLRLGKTLMKFALLTIQARFRAVDVRISAQDYLLKFYSEFGFQDTGKKYLEDDIPHTEMLKSYKYV
ncbi:GNAT family N-acetyltransferase [Kaistella sp. BT6-1-3]|uniref:GNAT family N-acetyltransferase n=1 Tax=Kaistella yananensis TaxID=2989820 RepID=A0ABT3JLU9_9FLAO|nr:GNAT family N-acetyltransferase [Kaistella yananensis]MCW4451734.1 GNAT family N-acetyltransferase [Kaistella yananensis]